MRSCAREVHPGGEITGGALRRLHYFAPISLRCARMKTAARHISEAALPNRHLFGLFRACSSYPPRVVKSTEQITELGRLTRELVRFLRHPWRLLGAMGRFRRSENQSESARTACLPNHIATTDMRAARMRKYNLANIAGHGPVTALGWSVPSWLRFFLAGRPSHPGS